MAKTRVNCFLYHKGSMFLDRYIEKFGREPKQWTIESLHDLWIRTKKRCDSIDRNIWEYIEKIAETIPANDGKHITYFKRNNVTLAYVIEWNSTFKSYSLHTTSLSEFKSRDERINFYISSDLNFEMGEELFRLNKLSSKLHWVVFNVFWEKLEERLQEIFKGNRPKDSFVIQISDKKYIIKTEDKFGTHKRFKFECELDNIVDII